jgi:hypothetical protein
VVERRTLKLTRSNRDKAHQGVDAAVARGIADGKPWTLELRERTRTDEQNDALHGLIDQILKQRPHHFGMRMTKEAYKAVFMHALGREPTMLPNLEGDGFFPMGLSTSKLTVGEFSALIESILAWCAREGLTINHFDDGARDTAGESESPKPAVRAA